MLRLSERTRLRRNWSKSDAYASGLFKTRWHWYYWRRTGKEAQG
ncbi:hypothetical protein P1X16_05965 [Hymenobacter sp. YC55]|nr:hypothetical protein [Hymenobacter sp. YC55]